MSWYFFLNSSDSCWSSSIAFQQIFHVAVHEHVYLLTSLLLYRCGDIVSSGLEGFFSNERAEIMISFEFREMLDLFREMAYNDFAKSCVR